MSGDTSDAPSPSRGLAVMNINTVFRFSSCSSFHRPSLLPIERQFEGERGTFTWTITEHGERTTHFFGRQRPAVQAEPVTIRFCGKSVRKNTCPILRGDAYAIVGHRHLDRPVSVGDAQRQAFVGATRLNTGIIGVAHQVHKNLQHLVLLDADGRNVPKFADNLDVLPRQRTGVHAQAIFH